MLCITFKSPLCICLAVLIIVSRIDRSSDNYIELEDLDFNFRTSLVKLGSARDIVELLQIILTLCQGHCIIGFY